MSSSFICTISGENAEQPVVSPRSGEVFEKRLIIKYIEENGSDPFTKEKLEVSEVGNFYSRFCLNPGIKACL